MESIVNCSCGIRVRVPANTTQAMRCPKCKLELPRQQAAVHAESAGSAAGASCPICRNIIAQSDLIVRCPGCQQLHHEPCWMEMGGCSAYGCANAPVAPSKNSSEPAKAGWGDFKTCPSCNETIRSSALRCRYCRTYFGTAEPLTREELRDRKSEEASLQVLRPVVVFLFVATLTGCLAPLTLLIGLFAILPQRRALSKAGPFFVVMGYVTLALSLLYSLLLSFFVLLEVAVKK